MRHNLNDDFLFSEPVLAQLWLYEHSNTYAMHSRQRTILHLMPLRVGIQVFKHDAAPLWRFLRHSSFQ